MQQYLHMNYSIEKHKVKTSEGWFLDVKRYKAEKSVAPIVIFHGLGANSNCLDFNGDKRGKDWEKYSLAYYLLNGGEDGKIVFDIWVVNLRGRGEKTFEPRKEPLKYNWNVDTYIKHDAFDVIKYIKRIYYIEEGKEKKIFWIGKSMGGMIAYAYGQIYGNKDLKGVITIGSPVNFEDAANSWGWLVEFVKIFYPRRISLPVPWFKIIEGIGLKEKFMENMANLENLDRKLLDRYMDKVFDNTISLKVFTQFVFFIRYKDFCEFPRWPWLCDIFYKWPFLGKVFYPYSYKNNLDKFKLPILMIAGGNDKQAPPEDIWKTFQKIGSKDKKYVEFSEKNW